MTPTVSVIIPSYNHERYVRQCIQSVLEQTFQDFEIVITDDGSSDSTVHIIKSFTDPRIKLFKHKINKGASVAANNCILNSHGKYVAMLSSDDMWFRNKLEVQVEYLETHLDIPVVFSEVEWIDETGNLLLGNFTQKNIFNIRNRTRFEWLRHFFFVGNSLCHPSSLIRREKYLEIGLLEPSFATLPDFDLWVRFCLKYDIHILDKPLVYFRRINEWANASGANINNLIRYRYEYKQLLDHYLMIQNIHDLLKIFPDALRYGKASSDMIPFLLSRIAIDSGTDFRMLWGLDTIRDLLKDTAMAEKLENQCGFTHQDFIQLAGECDVYKISLIPIQANFPVKSVGNVSQHHKFLLALKKYFMHLFSLLRVFLSISREFVRNILR